MSDTPCPSQRDALLELERLAPSVPLLALGQTVFWDEPMKASVAMRMQELGLNRRFLAGVHDTDYFAKSPGGKVSGQNAPYLAVPHNDSTTKGLWSAAGEFSALFASETVVTRDRFQMAGAKVGMLAHARPGTIEEATEAWGWRGIVDTGSVPLTTADTPLDRLWPTLRNTFDWVLDLSLESLAGKSRPGAETAVANLRRIACDAAADELSLGAYYERLTPVMYNLVANRPVAVETTRTSELLRFDVDTASRARFAVLGVFLDPETATRARGAYDAAVAGSEIYPLERFGVGAIPFDLYIPGLGRGTLRLGRRGGVVNTPHPVGFRFRVPPSTPAELARLIAERFGPGCVLLGKAVTLITQLATEHVFVFHEGASSYTGVSLQFAKHLAASGVHLPQLYPFLRVRYDTWGALAHASAWLRLPEPLRRPFGVDELSASSFAARVGHVAESQAALFARLGELRRPLELIQALAQEEGGAWQCLADQFGAYTRTISGLRNQVEEIKSKKAAVLGRLRASKAEREAAEREKGEHWRSKVWHQPGDMAAREDRERLAARVLEIDRDIATARSEWLALQAEQDAAVGSAEAKKAREGRSELAVEAELARLQLVRSAVLATDGLRRAGLRPSAWWFPLVSPDGSWFNATVASAQFRLEEWS